MLSNSGIEGSRDRTRSARSAHAAGANVVVSSMGWAWKPENVVGAPAGAVGTLEERTGVLQPLPRSAVVGVMVFFEDFQAALEKAAPNAAGEGSPKCIGAGRLG